MQIKLKFDADGKKISLPIAYRHAVQSMIYNALRPYGDYSDRLHDEGNNVGTRYSYKLFTFSQLSGDYTVEDKNIIFSGCVYLEIRCVEPVMCQHLLESFRRGTKVRLLSNDLRVLSCRLENNVIFQYSASIKMLSPVAVYITEPDGHTRFFSPDEDEFYQAIEKNALRKWCSKFGSEEGFKFSIRPGRSDAEPRKNITKFKTTYINAWFGEFDIYGNAKTLDFLYNTGLGSKNSQGFGMFQII